MTGTWIDIAEGFRGYLAVPQCGSGPGLLLLQEIFGVNPHMRDVADLYAEEGYVVLAPDLFWRLEPGVELGHSEADLARAFALYGRSIQIWRRRTSRTARGVPARAGGMHRQGGGAGFLPRRLAGVSRRRALRRRLRGRLLRRRHREASG